MTTETRRIALMILGLAAFSLPSACAEESKDAAGSQRVDFVKQIQPILRARCHECHGADAQEAGLRLDVRKAALSGGDNGKVIVAGKSDKSPLVLGILGEDGCGTGFARVLCCW